MKGTTPAGAVDEREAARWVRAMFGRVAHRYDLANHLLSFNIDRYWRTRTVSRVRDVLLTPGARVLDLCCGTGDLLLALESPRASSLMGTDFCHPMLTAAAIKIARRRSRSLLFESDVLQLPLSDASLDLITVAFGFRNLANYENGLKEMSRVLSPSGKAAILEFSQPSNRLFARVYELYSRKLLPSIGGVLTGSKDAYTYLPESVRKFPPPEELASMMRQAGFTDVTFESMTGGIVALHVGSRRN
jgi:demethylmenaquinone methyltransferase/2-methoxy-6-polyprenyl-1,4-benzoquinol methylase